MFTIFYEYRTRKGKKKFTRYTRNFVKTMFTIYIF